MDCDGGASTRTTPVADTTPNDREYNLKLHIADGAHTARSTAICGDTNIVIRSDNGLAGRLLPDAAHVPDLR